MINNANHPDNFPPLRDSDYENFLNDFDPVSGPDLNAPNPHDNINASRFDESSITQPTPPTGDWTNIDSAAIDASEEKAQGRVSKLFMDAVQDLKKNDGNGKLSINSTFFKNQQTEWVGKYNLDIADKGLNEAYKLICKPNGYFFVEDDTVSGILQRDFGYTAEKASEQAKHFELSFIGWTKSNKAKKNNQPNESGPTNRFKSMVLNIVDPEDPDAILAFSELQAQRLSIVEKALGEKPSIEEATAKLLEKSKSIIDDYNAKNNTIAFTGVGDNLFLNRSAVYNTLNEIPGLKDSFKVEPLDEKYSSVNYRGFSPKLDSYFDDKVALHKVVTKDPQKLPQEKLEELVRNHLENNPDVNLVKTPSSAFLEAKSDTPENTNVDSTNNLSTQENNSQSPNESDGFDHEDSDQRNKKKSIDVGEEDKEKLSLGEILANNASKMLSYALLILLELLKKTLALIAVLVMGPKYLYDIKNGKDPSPLPFSDVLTRDFPKFGGLSNGVAANNDNSNPLTADAKEIQKALDAEIKADKDKEFGLHDALAERGMHIASPIEYVNEKINSLDGALKSQLDTKALEFIDRISKEETQEILDGIHINTLHGISEGMGAKLAEKSIYHDDYGILLGKGDRVNYKDSSFGVLAAYDVGGSLVYALARENEEGNYLIEFAEPKEIELQEHNAIQFDNDANLLAQVDSALKEQYGDSAAIEPIEIFDVKNPSDKALSISEISSLFPFVRPEMINPDIASEVPVITIDAGSDISKALANQPLELHTDLRYKREANIHGNIHGVFGSLLDVNDLVGFQHPSNEKDYEGTIIGAYADKSNSLKYIVKKENSYFDIAATNLKLLDKNKGELSAEENKSVIDDQYLVSKFGLDTHKDFMAGRIKLIHSDHYQVSEDLQYEILKQGKRHSLYGFLAGDTPTHLKIMGSNGKPQEYMKLGEALNTETGENEIVAMKINRSLIGRFIIPDIRLAEIEKFKIDDPNVHVVSNGFTNKDVIKFAGQIGSMLATASLKATAHVYEAFKSPLDTNLYGQLNANQLAREVYAKNSIVTQILKRESSNSKDGVDIVYGQSSDLSQSTINLNSVDDLINNPDSSRITGDQTIINNPPTLVELMGDLDLTNNRNESNLDSALDAAATHPNNVDNEFDQLLEAVPGFETNNLGSDSDVVLDKFDQLLMSAHLLNPNYLNDESIDVSQKLRATLFNDCDNLSKDISSAFDVYSTNAVPNLHESKLSPDIDFNLHVSGLPDIDYKITNIREALEDYKSEYETSLRMFTQHLEGFSQNLNEDDLKSEKFDKFKEDFDVAVEGIKYEINTINKLGEFISNIEDFYYTTDPYSEVVGKNNQKYVLNEAKYEAIIAPIVSRFDTKVEPDNNNKKEASKDNTTTFGNDF